MLRPLYRYVLRLHPPAFRKRFAEEMLSIFDHSVGKPNAFRLLTDGLLSLARQWALRPEFWREFSPTQPPTSDGIPSFSTLDPFRPRAGAVIHGLVLSTAVFCVTSFAIKYSWIHVLHVRIPEVQFESPRSIQANPGSVARDSAERDSVSPHSEATAPAIPTAIKASTARPQLQESSGARSQSSSSTRNPPSLAIPKQVRSLRWLAPAVHNPSFLRAQ